MLATSVKRAMVEEIVEKSRSFLENRILSGDDTPEDVLLYVNGVEETLNLFDDKELDELLYRATEETVEEIKDAIKDGRDYVEQVRRDYAREVGIR